MTNKDFLKECLFKEIELIQENIKRIGTNSFMIKGWTITLIVAALLLKGSKFQVLISLIPLLSFWVLDAYFLRLERKYRKLYDWVIINRLKTEEYLFDMNAPRRFRKDVKSTIHLMFSITLAWFYGFLLLLIIAYSIFIFTH
jgi:hypothetical protein